EALPCPVVDIQKLALLRSAQTGEPELAGQENLLLQERRRVVEPANLRVLLEPFEQRLCCLVQPLLETIGGPAEKWRVALVSGGRQPDDARPAIPALELRRCRLVDREPCGGTEEGRHGGRPVAAVGVREMQVVNLDLE